MAHEGTDGIPEMEMPKAELESCGSGHHQFVMCREDTPRGEADHVEPPTLEEEDALAVVCRQQYQHEEAHKIWKLKTQPGRLRMEVNTAVCRHLAMVQEGIVHWEDIDAPIILDYAHWFTEELVAWAARVLGREAEGAWRVRIAKENNMMATRKQLEEALLAYWQQANGRHEEHYEQSPMLQWKAGRQ